MSVSPFQFLSNAAGFCCNHYQKWMKKAFFYGEAIDYSKMGVERIVRSALGILFIEPHQMLKIGALSLIGWKKDFHWYGLNPKELNPKQAEMAPILLIHGNLHNQGVWVSLAKAIQNAGIDNPVYTVNLGLCSSMESDVQKVDKKIAQIKEQYRKRGKDHIQVHLLGYSGGGGLAYLMGIKEKFHFYEAANPRFTFPSRANIRRDDIGNIFLLGEVRSSQADLFEHPGFKDQYESTVHEMMGSNDFLIPHHSVLPNERQSTFDATHLGLPFSSAFHKKIINWIKFIKN